MKKRSVLLIYGEKTVQINKRVPESKRKEIEGRFNDILKQYENPQRVDIDVANGKSVKKEQMAFVESLPENAKFKKSTASGNDIEKVPAVKFEQIASLPLGTKLVKEYGRHGALRSLADEQFFTKRMNEGKIEILSHESYESALEYANQNFK